MIAKNTFTVLDIKDFRLGILDNQESVFCFTMTLFLLQNWCDICNVKAR